MFLNPPLFPLARRSVAVVRVLLLVVGLWSAAVAQASDKSDLAESDQKALAAYHLTSEKLDRFDAVNKKIAEAMKTDPQLTKEMASGVLNVGSTLDDALGQFDRRAPHLAALLKSAGTTNRDYVLTIFSAMFATTGQMMKQADQPLPAYIPADNVALAEKNPARFQEVMATVESLSAKARKGQAPEEGTEN